MFLNKLEKNPSPLICFILKNLDFNLSQYYNYLLNMVYYF